MNGLDLTLPTAAENLALDEAMLLAAEGVEAEQRLRLWESRDDVVIVGSSVRVAEDVDVEACRRDRVPILRRCSGGGTVVLGPGCLVFTLVLPVPLQRHLAGIGPATRGILERLGAALRPLVPGIEVCGTSDLAVGGRKVSGNSQRWLRRHFLHHGTLLYDFDAGRAARYLKMPRRQPGYRRHRAHEEFLTNLPLERATLRQLLVDTFGACEAAVLPSAEVVSNLVETKYGSDAWNLRR